MTNRFGPVLMVGQPVAGALMQIRDINVGAQQTLIESFDKQRVIAKPLTLRIQREDKQIVPFDLGQHLLRVVAPGDGIAQ